MLRALNAAIRERKLARVNFLDGEFQVGFVVYADEESFDIFLMDNVFNQKVLDEDEEGGIMLEKEEDIEEIDFLFVKATFKTEMVDYVISDVSHKFSRNKTEFIRNITESIYHSYNLQRKIDILNNNLNTENEELNDDGFVEFSGFTYKPVTKDGLALKLKDENKIENNKVDPVPVVTVKENTKWNQILAFPKKVMSFFLDSKKS